MNRREFLAVTAAAPLMQTTTRTAGSMFVCMHEASSDRFDFRAAMEGYAKAGIKAVEPALTKNTEDDYKRAADNLREAGEIARPFGVSIMLEFSRMSRFVGSLPTALQLVRAADHPHVRVMIDTYHFWGGISKFEDLELLRDGELHHLHFEDVPADPPREIQGQPNRVYPGEGIAPLRRIVELLKRKKYAGAASLEMFNPAIQSMDPYEVAKRARAAIEPLIA